MKRLIIAAAALLLGSSAFAGAPSFTPATRWKPAAQPAHSNPAHARHRVMAGGDPNLDLSVDPDRVDGRMTGMGGPYEPVDADVEYADVIGM